MVNDLPNGFSCVQHSSEDLLYLVPIENNLLKGKRCGDCMQVGRPGNFVLIIITFQCWF